MVTIDPKASKMPWQSPYISMDNNPILFNDSKGDCPQCVSGAVIGVLVERLSQIGINMIDKDIDIKAAMNNLDLTDVFVAGTTGFVEGFFTGGSAKIATFLAKSKNRKIMKVAGSFIIETTENILKDVLNKKDINIVDSVNGALMEMGVGGLLPKTKLNRKIEKRIGNKLNKATGLLRFKKKYGFNTNKAQRQLNSTTKAFNRKKSIN